MPNEHYHDVIWDHLYGLLDPSESRDLRVHVQECSACRVALAEAERHQQLLARAARAVQTVPAFSAPGDNVAAPANTPAAVDADAQTVPLTTPLVAPPARRRAAWAAIAAWAAAAALLVAAYGLNQAYHRELTQQLTRVNQLRSEVETLDGRFVALRTNLEKEKQEHGPLVQARMPPQLQVLTAAQVIPEAPTNIHVTTRDRTGKLRDAEVTTSLVAPGGKVVHQQTVQIAGEGNIAVPGVKLERAEKKLDLVVKAQVEQADARVSESLIVARPAHASHLALNKSMYYVGEVLFFRSLTLDRYHLKPPAQPLALRFALLDADGRTVKEIPAQTGPGGVSGGEMALTQDLVGGTYTFQVGAAKNTDALVVPQTRTIEIVRDDPPQIEFDRNRYRAGDQIALNFRSGQQAGVNPFANKAVNIKVVADGQPVAQTGNQGVAPFQGQLDNAGNLSNIRLQLPAQIKNGAEVIAEIIAKDGKGNKKVVQPIPVVPSERTIDFFPEGGDLVAGVPNRVYYRVRSPQGDNLQPEGQVVVLANKQVLHDSGRQQGLGYFTFIPDAREAYSVRITGPEGVTDIASPFQKLGIKPEGLVLHSPQSVGKEGEPLSVVLRNQGPTRRVLLQTTCRGQIVDQQYLDLKAGSHTVKLEPAPGAAGILRLTALEAVGEQFHPVAERLLFRMPAGRLNVACRIANGAGPFQTGTTMTLNLKVQDEKQASDPTWMLAAVVDEKFRAEKNERSLGSHFYLGSELGDDLDNANVLVHDAPEARKALDLLLGTQGWRRFVRNDPHSALALSPERTRHEARDRSVPAMAFLSLQNTSTQTLQNQYQAAMHQEIARLVERANGKRLELLEERSTRAQLLEQALRDLAQVHQLPGEYFRLGVGILVAGLLVTGGLLLTVGLLRRLRSGAGAPRACFAGAFLCLFVCLALYFVFGRLPQGQVAGDSVARVRPSDWPEFSVDSAKNITAAAATAPTSSPPVGLFAAPGAAPVPAEHKAFVASAPTPTSPSDQPAKRTENVFLRAQTSQTNPSQANTPAEQQRASQNFQGNEEIQRRFLRAANKAAPAKPAPANEALSKDKATAAKAKGSPATKKDVASSPGGIGGLNNDGVDSKYFMNYYAREYAHRLTQVQGRLDLQDTLLWHPLLFSTDGTAQVSFDLSQNLTTYRILVYANSASGRLGFYEGQLEVRAAPK